MRLQRKDVRKLWFLVLTLLTAIYVGAIIVHTINYQRYIEETTNRFLDYGFDYEFIEGFVDFFPWHMYGMGPWIILLGPVICFLWFAPLFVAKMARLEKSERETSTTT